MFLMKIHNLVTEGRIIGALNAEPLTSQSYDRFLEKYVRGVKRDAQPKPEHGWRMPKSISREESQPMRAARVSEHLRRFVDAWLETGRNTDGYESPGNRDIGRSIYTKLAVMECLKKCPPDLIFSSISSELVLFIGEPKWKAPISGFPEAVMVEAKVLLFGLMVSDWKERLCKCRYSSCGRYFVLARLRQSYQHGIFCCREHQRLASAIACTKQKRRSAAAKLIELAAGQLLKWQVNGSDWQGDRSKKKRLASALSSTILNGKDPNLKAHRPQVKVNWVTRNRERIEQRRLEIAKK